MLIKRSALTGCCLALSIAIDYDSIHATSESTDDYVGTLSISGERSHSVWCLLEVFCWLTSTTLKSYHREDEMQWRESGHFTTSILVGKFKNLIFLLEICVRDSILTGDFFKIFGMWWDNLILSWDLRGKS